MIHRVITQSAGFLLGSDKSGVSKSGLKASSWGNLGIYSSRLQAAPRDRLSLTRPPVQLSKLGSGTQEVADIARQGAGLLRYTSHAVGTRPRV